MRKDEKGSVVVEAVLTFTVFILVMAALVSIISVALLYMRMQFALTNTASELSTYSYVYSRFTSIKEGHDNIKSLSEDAKGLIEQVGDLQGSLDGLAQGDINFDSLTEAAKNEEALAAILGDIAENPLAMFQSFIALAGESIFSEGKTLLLKAISRPILAKNLDFDASPVGGPHIDADTYLKGMGVKGGIMGISFDKSKLFDDENNKVIDIVVEYEMKIPMSPFPLVATMINRAATFGWMDGDGTNYESGSGNDKTDSSSEPEESDEITFKDAIFEREVRKALKKPYGPITKTDVLNITNLSLPSTVTDIGELEYFKNLEEFLLMESQVSDISSMAELVNLKTLWLSGNQITDWSSVAHVEDVKGRP
ncbi:MAG: leucine-rich repeat domain-containing protein [Christensenella sp.]